MSSRYIVYKHTTPSGKSYIGITTRSLRERIRGGYLHNRHFKSAIEKYGWQNIKTEILADTATAEEASLLESYYIAAFETNDRSKGYNVELGGVYRNSFSDETRKKISEAAKRRHRPCTPEQKIKLSQKAKKKAVRNVDTGEEFPSIAEAARTLKHSAKHIADVCHGRSKRAAGYRWEFING